MAHNMFIFVLMCFLKEKSNAFSLLGLYLNGHMFGVSFGAAVVKQTVNLTEYSDAAARQSTVVVCKGFRDTVGFQT